MSWWKTSLQNGGGIIFVGGQKTIFLMALQTGWIIIGRHDDNNKSVYIGWEKAGNGQRSMATGISTNVWIPPSFFYIVSSYIKCLDFFGTDLLCLPVIYSFNRSSLIQGRAYSLCEEYVWPVENRHFQVLLTVFRYCTAYFYVGVLPWRPRLQLWSSQRSSNLWYENVETLLPRFYHRSFITYIRYENNG